MVGLAKGSLADFGKLAAKREVSRKMGFCRYHRQEEPLCDSHILPKAFFRRVRSLESTDELRLAKLGEKFPKRRPQGDYDGSIMCSAADGKFGVFDQYAIEFFEREVPEAVFRTSDGREWVKVSVFDFRKLSLFLLSYIWRAHHSKITPYADFSVGSSFEEKIRYCLTEQDGSEKSWFSFVIFWLYAKHDDVVFPIRYPFRMRMGGYNFVYSYFLNFKVIAKLDSRATPDWVKWIEAKDNSEITIPAESYEKSADRKNDIASLRLSLARGLTW